MVGLCERRAGGQDRDRTFGGQRWAEISGARQGERQTGQNGAAGGVYELGGTRRATSRRRWDKR